jgi:hypothetical protein
MTNRKTAPPEAALVAIDVAKHRNEVLIDPSHGRRRRMTILNTKDDHDRFIATLHALSRPVMGCADQHRDGVATRASTGPRRGSPGWSTRLIATSSRRSRPTRSTCVKACRRWAGSSSSLRRCWQR